MVMAVVVVVVFVAVLWLDCSPSLGKRGALRLHIFPACPEDRAVLSLELVSVTEGHRQCQECGSSQEGCPNASAGVPGFCSVAAKAHTEWSLRAWRAKHAVFYSSARAGHRHPPALALGARARKGRGREYLKGARAHSRRGLALSLSLFFSCF